MEERMYKIYARSDERIQLKIFPGHFATPQSHITHFLDMTTMKSRCSEAKRIAKALSVNYETSIPIDTIICMDGLEVVGAYLAEELTQAGVLSMNAHQTIYVTSPEYNSVGQMIFRENVQMMINGKNILILSGSITTGETLIRAVESILYYGGKIRGVAAIFSAVNKVAEMPVHSIFTLKDIPDYGTYKIQDCPLCKNRQKIDAIVNSYGYAKI
ncbi:orotate phosphoribosyltransferase [Blautia schinkii]|nr:orotate phosphoribosyltransferase [Blautia schinkii]